MGMFKGGLCSARTVLLVPALACMAEAGIISTTGDFLVEPSATADYTSAAYRDPTTAPIRIWSEQGQISLSSSVVLDSDLADPMLQYKTAGQVAFAARVVRLPACTRDPLS